MRLAGPVLLCLFAITSTGCLSKKKAPPPLPPLQPPVIDLPSPGPAVDLPPEATTPPPAVPAQPAPTPQDSPSPNVITVPRIPEPAKPNKPARRATRPRPQPPTPATVQPQPAAPEPQPPTVPAQPPPATPPPPPQLGELISDQRRQQLESQIATHTAIARSALDAASTRKLSRSQSETVRRIQTFLRQSEEARTREISTALQLAQRAGLLAQDLLASFK